MATFPTGIDDGLNAPSTTDTIVATDVSNIVTALLAVEAKVGADSSAVVTSHDYKMTHLPAQVQAWDMGAYGMTATKFTSDITTGTVPINVTSTTKCTNLNADTVDGKDVDGSNGAGEITTNDGTQTLTNKTLTTADVGTPSAGTLTNCDGLPMTTGVTGTLATGNGGTGATASANAASGVVVLNGDSKLPAVDGSLLTNLVSVPSGSITMWGGAIASPPADWLICDGSAVSRSTYSTLFGIISTIYGSGDESTTFNLPNFTNRFPYGANEGSSAGNASVGSARARTELAGNDNSVTIKLTGIGHNVEDDGSHVYVVDTMPPYLAVAFMIKT